MFALCDGSQEGQFKNVHKTLNIMMSELFYAFFNIFKNWKALCIIFFFFYSQFLYMYDVWGIFTIYMGKNNVDHIYVFLLKEWEKKIVKIKNCVIKLCNKMNVKYDKTFFTKVLRIKNNSFNGEIPFAEKFTQLNDQFLPLFIFFFELTLSWKFFFST